MDSQINIVYQNNNMPGKVLPVFRAPDGSYAVTWSRQPLPDSDIVVYFNHYTYDRRAHHRTCPQALKVLYMYEPPAVDPMQYTHQAWRQFDHILTWNTYLTASSPAFTFSPGAYYDLPYCSDYGIPPQTTPPDPSVRERAICQICGDKYSPVAEELYSLRRKVARWFHQNATTRMDVFGKPPMAVPNYKGPCSDKAQTLSRYRYALCFENTYHPAWTQGYLTEKILDCMTTGTIPVYYGCSNIEDLVPPDCFLDYRSYDSLQALDQHLQKMTDGEYLRYTDRMLAFVRSYNAPYRHSALRLYEDAANICNGPPAALALPHHFPVDYFESSSINAKLRFLAMRALFPCYKHYKFLFSGLRWINKIKGVFC